MSKKILDLVGLQHYDEKIKSYIDSEVAGAKALDIKFETATEVPQVSEAQSNVIYLVPSVTSSDINAYDEFIKVGDKMEFIGTTAIEIDGITTAEIDEMFTA